MRGLLDTSVLVTGIPDGLSDAAISVATLAELRFGVERLGAGPVRDQRSARLRGVLELFEPLPVDALVAQQWGVLAAHTAAHDRQPRRRAMDLLIAATAQVHGLALLTRDADLLWLGDIVDVRAV